MLVDYRIPKMPMREVNARQNVHINNYNMKRLKKANHTLAKDYVAIKYKGGSIKQFGTKLKKFGQRVGRVASKVYKVAKKGLKWVKDHPVVQGAIGAVGNALGTAVGVPGLGTIVNTGINAADSITDAGEKVVKAIRDKNPDVTVDEAKNLYKTVRDSYDKIKSDLPHKEKQQQQIESKLPDAVKAEGFKKVMSAAKYLPLLDVDKVKTTETKGGAIKKTFTKPTALINKYLGANGGAGWKAADVNAVGGRIFLGNQAMSSGRVGLSGKCKEAGKVKVDTKDYSKKAGSPLMDKLAMLKSKYA